MSDAFTERKSVILTAVILGMTLSAGACGLGRWNWALGMAAGTLAGIANYHFMFRHLASIADRNARLGAHAARFLLRYLFLGLMFFLAFKTPQMDFWAFLLGFLVIHLAIGLFLVLKLFRKSR